MNACQVYRASDGALTRRFYGELRKRGPLGVIAMNLFRAMKCSRRAKKYGPAAGVGDRSYRDMAYERKGDSLKELCAALGEHGVRLGITWGWGHDGSQAFHRMVLYVDLPDGQCSFHSAERYDGPDYPGGWDGERLSEQRIINFCQRVFENGGKA